MKRCYNCRTREAARQLLNELHKKGYVWTSGRSLLGEDRWTDYEANTCYYISGNTICYGSVNFADKGTKIEVYPSLGALLRNEGYL